MSIEITTDGITKRYSYYPYDAFYVDGKQVKEAWLDGVKYYPKEIPPEAHDFDCYSAEYNYSFEENSDDGHAYFIIQYIGISAPYSYIQQASNITVAGAIDFYIPHGYSLIDCIGSSQIGANCYAHNTYTVTCNIPDSIRNFYGGLRYPDICDQFATGYTYSDEYICRFPNGQVSSSQPPNGVPWFISQGWFGIAGAGTLNVYNQKGRYGTLYLTARIRVYNSYSGYSECPMRFYENAMFSGTGPTKDLLKAMEIFSS